MVVPSRITVYPARPLPPLSVAAPQVSATDVPEGVVAWRLVGVVGAVRSRIQAVDAHFGGVQEISLLYLSEPAQH